MKHKLCKVNSCGDKHYGLGYCAYHWWRFKRYGDPLLSNFKNRRFRSNSLKRPDLTESQQINICAIFSGIRA